MIVYFVQIIRLFLPVALIAGIIPALWKLLNERGIVKYTGMAVATGLFVGSVLYVISIRHLIVVGAQTYIDLANILSAILTIVTIVALQFSRRGSIIQTVGWNSSIFFIVAITVNATFSFLLFASDQTLSVTSVLNTEMVLNIGGILTGVLTIAFLVVLVNHLAIKIPKYTVLTLLIALSVLLILKWSAEFMLGMMRTGTLELASGLLSFVAKVINFSNAFTYIQIIFLGVLSIVFFWRLKWGHMGDPNLLNSAMHRKIRNMAILELRWLKIVIASIVIIASVLLYYDLYASKPPTISTPVRLMPDDNGLIKVKIDNVKDGKLYRFSYVTDDGHVIRFFVINRFKDQVRMGVVFDTCVMCGGDMGYIQKGNDVICLACNVSIFLPSIGKSGGCNPIPLNHRIENGYIIITVKDLESKKDFFSEVVR